MNNNIKSNECNEEGQLSKKGLVKDLTIFIAIICGIFFGGLGLIHGGKYIYTHYIAQKFTYEIQNNEIVITGETKAGKQMSKLTIPSKIDGMPVKGIDAYSFSQNKVLTEVIIKEGVTNIGQAAFCGCDNLKKVRMSDSVVEIETDAFLGCSHLEEIKLSENITVIKEGAFTYTK